MILKSKVKIIASYLVCVWNLMTEGVKEKQLCAKNPFSGINALWPQPFWPQNPMGTSFTHFGSVYDRYKEKAIMHCKSFSAINASWPWPLPIDLEINRAHPLLIGVLCVKLHDNRCKGKAIMWHKPFIVISTLWPWPMTLWPQTSMTHWESVCEVSRWLF